MSKKLYVGNLDYTVRNDDLKDFFAEAGEIVDAVVIMDRNYSDRSKGFGFVEFAKDEDALKAIEMFNGKDFKGRALVVNEARPPREQN